MNKLNIDDIYQELREKFIIVGLTGALGSGCTQSASILSHELNISDISSIKAELMHNRLDSDYDNLEQYRLRKIENFIIDKGWEPFYHLKVSNLLFCLFFNEKNKFESSQYNTDKWLSTRNISIDEVHHLCSNICSLILDNTPHKENEPILENLLNKVDEIISNNVDKSHSTYTTDFQKIGEELRSQGFINFTARTTTYKITTKHVFTISSFIKNCIKRLRQEGKKFFVIDALRNLHEINYFKARYSNFYLFSINADEDIRQNRILSSFGYNTHDYDRITKREKKN